MGALRFGRRFNSTDTLLATGGDDSYIIIWKYEPGKKPPTIIGFWAQLFLPFLISIFNCITAAKGEEISTRMTSQVNYG